MTDALPLVGAFAAGLLLGGFYFGSLWAVVRRLPNARRPATLLFTSAVVRLALVLTAFFLVMAGRPERLAVCLIGFLVARGLLTRRARAATQAPLQTPRGGKPS